MYIYSIVIFRRWGRSKGHKEETDIDALAVSIGNAHGLYKDEPHLNFELLQTIAGIADVPLVLHGGTGLTTPQFAKGVELGIRKINIGTEVKKTFIEAFIKTHEENIQAYDLVGIPQGCKNAVKEMVKTNLQFFTTGWKNIQLLA